MIKGLKNYMDYMNIVCLMWQQKHFCQVMYDLYNVVQFCKYNRWIPFFKVGPKQL